MDFFEVVEQRRSIRKYEGRPIEEEKVEKLVDAILRAPSSRGSRPWEFVLVTDSDTIHKLAYARSDQPSFLKDAALAVVVCGDERASDIWMENTSIASTYVLLAAQALGLGACWIQMRERKQPSGRSSEAYVQEILGLPENLRVQAIIAVGYPAEEKQPYRDEELDFHKVHREKYTRA